MLLTIFLAFGFCLAANLVMISAVAFIRNEKLFSSAPEEARALIQPREKELFPGARALGWTLFVFSALMILGGGVIAIWDGFRNGFGFRQFFLRFVLIFTIYKLYDMIFFDYFLLMKFHFFQYFYPEAAGALAGRKYGFNIRSQLLKLFVIFPAASALAAWICSLFG